VTVQKKVFLLSLETNFKDSTIIGHYYPIKWVVVQVKRNHQVQQITTDH